MAEDVQITTFNEELFVTRVDALDYLRQINYLWGSTHEFSSFSFGEVNDFIKYLPEPLASKRLQLEVKISTWAIKIAELARSAALLNAADQGELRISIRRMIAALRSREYHFHEASLMSHEDQVYGIEPASQSERETFPFQATEVFQSAARKVSYLLLFIDSSKLNYFTPNRTVPSISGMQQRRDTAFIMMWMSEDHPELTDVKEGIVAVFQEFGIDAVRADDIEHEDVITSRIIEEISSAEFLIADLTGARPNVYYEVGYAHALGKRPILFKRKDTALHFDLAGRNVPSYVNVKDLKQKLRTRLEALLGLESSSAQKNRSTT